MIQSYFYLKLLFYHIPFVNLYKRSGMRGTWASIPGEQGGGPVSCFAMRGTQYQMSPSLIGQKWYFFRKRTAMHTCYLPSLQIMRRAFHQLLFTVIANYAACILSILTIFYTSSFNCKICFPPQSTSDWRLWWGIK